jgi:hypothetical protein
MPNVRGIPHSKSDLKAVRIFRGLSIYKVRGSRYWYLRLWDPETKKYLVKGTGEVSKMEARAAAVDFARSRLQAEVQVPVEFTFKHFAVNCLAKGSRLAADGERHSGNVKVIAWGTRRSLKFRAPASADRHNGGSPSHICAGVDCPPPLAHRARQDARRHLRRPAPCRGWGLRDRLRPA